VEAYLYEKLEAFKVRCNLCRHRCLIADGQRGICGVRENRAGRLETLVYGRLVAANVDPIEKKPIFHLLPGSRSYSIATVGCNFRCRFCQNSDIAQMPSDRDGMIVGQSVTPEAVVTDAEARGCRSISYTYTEPTVFFEFALETAKLAHGQGMKNIFVTNGYMSVEALEMAAPYLDAANVDLKAFSDDFYKKQCGARLQAVQESLRQMKAKGMLVEITTLIVPGLNDDRDELRALADFIVADLGAETPWHISRFHPTYKLTDRPPTPVKTLRMAGEIGSAAGLRYVYLGNVPGEGGEHTRCHQCGRTLIERQGFYILANRVKNDACPDCGTPVYGIGMSERSISSVRDKPL
jgi:pyruvate formate lyase activating enzyme